MPVGSYAPNGFGLYDRAGNVQEFVEDWYEADYYSHSPSIDPPGPPMPKEPKFRQRVIRDVGFQGVSAYWWLRLPYYPKWKTAHTGFRVVLGGQPCGMTLTGSGRSGSAARATAPQPTAAEHR
jgi:formylglycine-generating enzyme required for sulfatase activity